MNDQTYAYKYFFGADLKKLSDEVLKSIYASVRQEIDLRRAQKNVMNSNINSVELTVKELFADSLERHSYTRHKNRYLEELLSQDWSHIFNGGDTEEKYYVYIHYEPSGKHIKFISPDLNLNIKGLPFYIGKGCGDRAYDLKRNQGHGAILKQLLGSNKSPDEFITIVKSGLSEAKAFELESKLIYFFGTRYEKHRKGLLVNLEVPAKPNLVKRNNKQMKSIGHYQ